MLLRSGALVARAAPIVCGISVGHLRLHERQYSTSARGVAPLGIGTSFPVNQTVCGMRTYTMVAWPGSAAMPSPLPSTR